MPQRLTTHLFCTMMGGDIDVESVVGKGTTFIIRLPVDVKQVVPDLSLLQKGAHNRDDLLNEVRTLVTNRTQEVVSDT